MSGRGSGTSAYDVTKRHMTAEERMARGEAGSSASAAAMTASADADEDTDTACIASSNVGLVQREPAAGSVEALDLNLHSRSAIGGHLLPPACDTVELEAKGGCGRRLLPESMSDRRLIDDLPEGTAGTSCTFFVAYLLQSHALEDRILILPTSEHQRRQRQEKV